LTSLIQPVVIFRENFFQKFALQVVLVLMTLVLSLYHVEGRAYKGWDKQILDIIIDFLDISILRLGSMNTWIVVQHSVWALLLIGKSVIVYDGEKFNWAVELVLCQI
jgi:hypothetical protein